MRIFTEKPLVDFIENNPQYRVALQDWASKVKKCEWESIQDITNDFSDAQIISDVQCNFPLNIGRINFSVFTLFIGQYVYVREIVRS